MQTQAERDQYKANALETGIITSIDGTYNNTLFEETYKGSQFYYTKINCDNCKRLGVTYQSPQAKALAGKGTNIAVAKERATFTGATFKCYGSLPFDIMASHWKEDQHLYEILGEERKPYFDIEFRYIDDKHTNIQLEKINTVIKTAFETVGITINPAEHYAVCYNLGMCKSGTFAGLKKVSYHIIINNGYKFKCVDDSNKFCAKYIPQIINESQEFKLLFTQEGLSIDTGVYTKNRLFKLPYQSKANDNRPQIPDSRFSKQGFVDFLISYGVGEEYMPIAMDNVELRYEERIRQIRERVSHLGFRGNNWNFDAIGQFLHDVEDIDYKTHVPGDVSCRIPYLVNSIYNGRGISYQTWFCVGSAIKRCEPDYNKALALFTAWTQKYNPCETANGISTRFDSFSGDKCGFKTLLSLARLCNDKLDEYICKPWLTLFKTDSLPANTVKVSVNKRFIDYNDFLDLDAHRDTVLQPSTYFIKSPMGTGKTFNFTRYFTGMDARNNADYEVDELRVIYLSSRRAFAESIEQEFQTLGFKNYMKQHILSYESRIICSVESLRRLSDVQIGENTILFIDESESIFNVVSSETLAKNDLLTNLNALYKLIRLSRKVFVMDAFLSNRSIEAVVSIRDIITNPPFYYENTYKYAERTYYTIDKYTMQQDLITASLDNKRCVAVVGSRKYGKELLANLAKHKPGVNYNYYNCENPLSLTSVVNREWAGLDLLMYSPTITCGISYDNPGAKYDKLYIYAVNKGSCHFRDVIQAHKRVREFTGTEIAVCLNTEFAGFKLDSQPIYKDEIIDICTDIRAQLFFAEDTPASIKSQTNLDWVLNIHAHNTLEQNIHQIYMAEVAQCFFDLENIRYDRKETVYDLIISYDKIQEDWADRDIPDIDYNEYIRIYNMLRGNGITKPTLDEYKCYAKYIFRHRAGDRYSAEFFDAWHTETQREYIDNIKAFKEMLFKGFGTWRDGIDKCKLIEFTDIRVRAFKLIFDILVDLRLLTNEDNTFYKLDLSRELKIADFELTAEKLKQIDVRAINQVFKNYYFQLKNKDDQIDSNSAATIFNKLIEEYLGYKLKRTGYFQGRINGIRQPKISIYKILPKNTDICAFSNLMNDWGRILRVTVMDFD